MITTSKNDERKAEEERELVAAVAAVMRVCPETIRGMRWENHLANFADRRLHGRKLGSIGQKPMRKVLVGGRALLHHLHRFLLRSHALVHHLLGRRGHLRRTHVVQLLHL